MREQPFRIDDETLISGLWGAMNLNNKLVNFLNIRHLSQQFFT
jgi:hypothetical protein